MKTVIVVYIDSDGVAPMVEHILDGSLKQYKPHLTVDSSLHGYRIPMMNAKGEVES